jgi:hypothetical protein
VDKWLVPILFAILVALVVLVVRVSQVYVIVEPLATSPVAGLVANLGRT